MTTQIQRRRGTTAQHSTFTGAEAELTVDTTKDTVVVHDGSTVGGRPLLREDQSNLPTSAPTTGIYNASGALALSTNGTGRLFVDASGNVGVGGTPSARFEITTGAGTEARITSTIDNNADLTFYTNGVQRGIVEGNSLGLVLGTPGALPTFFVTNNTERLRITAAGLVGVGTSTPQLSIGAVGGNVLHLAGAGTTGVRVQNTSGNSVDIYAGTDGFINQSGSGVLNFQLAGSTKATLTSTGLGVGTTTVDFSQFGSNTGGVAIADIGSTNTGLKISDGSYHNYLVQAGNGNFYISHYGAGDTVFSNGASGEEACRIDASRRLLVGTSTARGDFFNVSSGRAPAFQIEGTSTNAYGMSITANSNSDNGAEINLAKSRGTNTGSSTIVQNNDTLARISFQGADGGELVPAAYIQADVDGTPGANDMPGRLVFSTCPDSGSSPVERLRITSQGLTMASNTGGYYGTVSTTQFHSFDQGSEQWSLGLRNANVTTPYGLIVNYNNGAPNNGSSEFLYCIDSSALRMSVRSNGGIANYQSNNVNLCDEREKKNIETLDSTWGCLKNWDLKKFHYNEDADTDDKRYGVIAQQVAQHCPEVITEWVKQKAEDAVLDEYGNIVTPAKEEIVRMGVKEQQMYWMAIKTLQEAQVRIETLEAEVAALKAQ